MFDTIKSMTDILAEFNLSTTEAAVLLGISIRTLYRWRNVGFGPRAVLYGPRNYKYSRIDIEHWLDNYYQWMKV